MVWYGHGAYFRLGFPACGLTVVPLRSEPQMQRAHQAGWWWANWGHVCKVKLAASTSWGLPLHPLPPWQCLVFVAMTNGRAGLPNPEQLSNAAVLRRPALTARSCTCPPRPAPWGVAPAHRAPHPGGAGLGIACAAEVQPASLFDTFEIW